jgi:asparaginyl-tRNA synthetase
MAAQLSEVALQLKTHYIDTDTGKDEDAVDGSQSSPYKSLAYAYCQHGGTEADHKYLVRASVTGAVSADGDPAERLVWKDPAKAAVKKAQSALDSHKKKLLKQKEQAAQEQAKEEARLKSLEEAKKVIITEDATLPKAVKINIGQKDIKYVLTDCYTYSSAY